jgi:hypothetical protein
MKPGALFISNEIYFDLSAKEGGVRVCTEEYLHLLRQLYDVKVLTVRYDISLGYRLRVKLGLNIYNDYCPEKYIDNLRDIIKKYNIRIVFLNLSNTAPFAVVIKTAFGDQVKVAMNRVIFYMQQPVSKKMCLHTADGFQDIH